MRSGAGRGASAPPGAQHDSRLSSRTIISSHEAFLPFRDSVADIGGCGAGVGVDGHALRNSWTGSRSARDHWSLTVRRGTFGGGAWAAARRGAAVLQSADSRGTDHVAAAAAGCESAQGMAGASGAEPGA